MPFHTISIMVLLPTEANVDVVPAEARINATACQWYHRCCCPQKLSWMSSLDEAIIDASRKSYCFHLKLISMPMPLLIAPPRKTSLMPQPTNLLWTPSPTKDTIHAIPKKVSISAADLQSYLQCHHLPELSLVPLPTETTIGVTNHWSTDPMLIHKSCVSGDNRVSYSNSGYQLQIIEDNELTKNQILTLLLL